MKHFIILLICGIIIAEQVVASMIIWFYISLGSYGDEDFFLVNIFGRLSSFMLGIILGIILFYWLKSSTINSKRLISWVFIIVIISSIFRFCLSEQLIPSLVHAAFSNNITYLKISIKMQKNLNVKDINGQTPLIRASERGNLNFIIQLIKAGADLNVQDNRGWTALMVAVYGRGYSQTEHCEIARQLINAGIDIDIKNDHGEDALALASKAKNNCSIDLLRTIINRCSRKVRSPIL